MVALIALDGEKMGRRHASVPMALLDQRAEVAGVLVLLLRCQDLVDDLAHGRDLRIPSRVEVGVPRQRLGRLSLHFEREREAREACRLGEVDQVAASKSSIGSLSRGWSASKTPFTRSSSS